MSDLRRVPGEQHPKGGGLLKYFAHHVELDCAGYYSRVILEIFKHDMAVVSEPLFTRVKRSASFAIAKKAKKRNKEFSSYSSSSHILTGLNEDFGTNTRYLVTKRSRNIVSVNDVQYRSIRSDTAKSFRKNGFGKSHREVCVTLKAEVPTSTDTYLPLQHRHFMDAIDGESGRHSDSEGDICGSLTCGTGNSSREGSSGASDTGDCDVIACQGRVVSRRYVDGTPVLFFPGVHSAMKYQFSNSSDSTTRTVSVVLPLSKAFDQLFDVLHESSHTNDHDASYNIAVVNRWTNVRTELTCHLTRSLMTRLRRSAAIRSSFACYGVLMRTLQAFPPTDGVPFSLSDLDRAIDDVSRFLESDTVCINKLSVLNVGLRLTFMISCLENELLNCKLWSKRRVGLSCVCSWLSAEKKFTFVKRIIQISVDFLQHSKSLTDNFVLAKESQDFDDHSFECTIQMLSELLPLLQRLIVLSQAVSAYPAQTADRIAAELSAEYSQINLLSYRCEFLESISVPLIKLKLCQRILERQYPGVVRARVCGVLTSLTLDCLLSTYMRRGRDVGTKSEPGCRSDSDWVPCCVDRARLPLERDVCEEFSGLLFMIVLSYVQVKKEDYVNSPLWDQATKKNESSLSTADITTLRNLPDQVEKLRHHLEEAIGSGIRLTKRTLVFLQMLSCLSDIC